MTGPTGVLHQVFNHPGDAGGDVGGVSVERVGPVTPVVMHGSDRDALLCMSLRWTRSRAQR